MNILSLAVVSLTEFIRNFTGFLGSSRRYQITSTSRISNATPRKLQPFIWTGEYTAPHSTRTVGKRGNQYREHCRSARSLERSFYLL